MSPKKWKFQRRAERCVRAPVQRFDSIRAAYQRSGVRGFYQRCGAHYRNPHETSIHALITRSIQHWSLDLSHVLDLACGSGEATLALWAAGARQVTGIDPYTSDAYQRRTHQAAERYTFDQIVAGALSTRQYSLIVCSYALHLVEESRLPQLGVQLSVISEMLLVITPHKRPLLKTEWGWDLRGELREARSRARCYQRAWK